MSSASPWIEAWFAAWELTSELRLPDGPPPTIVFYDSSCVYTTSPLTGGDAPAADGPALRGAKLPWRTRPHGGSLTLPDSSQVPVQLMSFANLAPQSEPFFVMAAPSYWAQKGHGREPGLTGVFLHEFAHTRQVRGMAHVIGPIDSTWAYPEELTDDAVQNHFGADSVYVAAYLAERDLLHRAANADSLAEVRALAAEAHSMMRSRHARWFTGGGLDRQTAINTMLGRRRWWAQDEGLALLLVVDRLLPEWPALEFSEPSLGALDLLERAVRHGG
jgi:hypothetical protein